MKRLLGAALLLGMVIPSPARAAPSISGSVAHTATGTAVMRAQGSKGVWAAWCVIGGQSFPLDGGGGSWSAEFWVIGEAPGAAVVFLAVDQDGTFTATSGGTY